MVNLPSDDANLPHNHYLGILPGIQLYGGNHFSGFPGKGGMRYNKAAGLALETQFYPDAPHHPAWPQPTVKAGETQRSRTEFRFFAV